MTGFGPTGRRRPGREFEAAYASLARLVARLDDEALTDIGRLAGRVAATDVPPLGDLREVAGYEHALADVLDRLNGVDRRAPVTRPRQLRRGYPPLDQSSGPVRLGPRPVTTDGSMPASGAWPGGPGRPAGGSAAGAGTATFGPGPSGDEPGGRDTAGRRARSGPGSGRGAADGPGSGSGAETGSAVRRVPPARRPWPASDDEWPAAAVSASSWSMADPTAEAPGAGSWTGGRRRGDDDGRDVTAAVGAGTRSSPSAPVGLAGLVRWFEAGEHRADGAGAPAGVAESGAVGGDGPGDEPGGRAAATNRTVAAPACGEPAVDRRAGAAAGPRPHGVVADGPDTDPSGWLGGSPGGPGTWTPTAAAPDEAELADLLERLLVSEARRHGIEVVP